MARKNAAEALPELSPEAPLEPQSERAPKIRRKAKREEPDTATEEVVADIRRRLAESERSQESTGALEEIAEHVNRAEMANASSRRIQGAIKGDALEGHRTWEFFHELQAHAVELKAAIERSWRRVDDVPEARDERLTLSEALDAVERTIDDLRSAVERAQNPEEGQKYDDVLAKAQAAWHEALMQADDIKDALRDDALAPKDRRQAVQTFVAQAWKAEDTTDKAYAPSAEQKNERPSIEKTAAYEAAARAEAQFHSTIHELLIAEFEQGERSPSKPSDARSRLISDLPAWEGVNRTVHGIHGLIAEGNMHEELREELLVDLQDRADLLHLELEKARDMGEETVNDKTNKIAAALHLIEDARHALLNPHAPIREHGPAPKIAVEVWSQQQEARINDIEREQLRLAKKIQKIYGKPPEELVAEGWSMGRIATRLTLDEAGTFARWKELDRKREELREAIDPALTARGERGEGQARANVAAENAKREKNEKDELEQVFFGGQLEDTGDSHVVEVEVHEINDALDAARAAGVKAADEIYANILTNPAVELLSFNPEDYLKQLARVHQAQEDRDDSHWIGKYAAEHRYNAANEVLREMRRELRDCGIDPKTGETLKETKAKKRKKSGK